MWFYGMAALFFVEHFHAHQQANPNAISKQTPLTDVIVSQIPLWGSSPSFC